MDLILCNQRGLIPGPNETLEAFQDRAEFCLSLKTDLLSRIAPPESLVESVPEDYSACTRLFGIAPDWVPVFYSNWRLSPWHGGAAWIFQLEKNSPLGALLQLRKNFHQKKTYLGLYKKEELMAHEMAHAGRMAFEEKKYEELLAYRSSNGAFARFFGPIIQSALESRLIVLLMITLLMMDLYFLFSGAPHLYWETQSFKLVPLLLIGFAFFRLYGKQARLAKAEKNLEKIAGKAAPFILYRLTDSEIEAFAKDSEDQIKAYMQNEPSLRWQVIRMSYLKS